MIINRMYGGHLSRIAFGKTIAQIGTVAQCNYYGIVSRWTLHLDESEFKR